SRDPVGCASPEHPWGCSPCGVSILVSQLAQHPGQIQFPGSGLKAALHRGVDPALDLGGARALTEEIGIATEVLDRRERGASTAARIRGCVPPEVVPPGARCALVRS